MEKQRIFPYTAECIRKIHEKGYYAIAITNQSGVVRGNQVSNGIPLKDMQRCVMINISN